MWDDQVWDCVDAAVERLEDAWRAGREPDIERLLPATEGPCRRAVLVTLIAIDQEHRWRMQQRQSLEDYLRRWPELREDSQALLDLLNAECCIRRDFDRLPSKAEIEGRFPGLASQLDLAAIIADGRESRLPVSTRLVTSFMKGRCHYTGRGAPCLSTAGDRIGRYEVQTVLGQGGMGVVYLARDTDLERLVAVKVLHPWICSPSQRGDLLLQEARTAAGLKHPAIVPVYDSGRSEQGSAFFVMEYVDGKSLADMLVSGPIGIDAAVAVATQIAGALQAAHQQGFVHRDVKPVNVLIDAGGQARLTDFGLAMHDSGRNQQSGEFSGTLPYMAPEQIRGDACILDGRADIWALGAVLYEMLTGRRPFVRDSIEALAEAILHHEPVPPGQINPMVPADLTRICLKCLAKEVKERYQTANDLARDLHAWQTTKSSRRGWRSVAWAFAGILLCGLLFAVFWLRPWSPSEQPDRVGDGEAMIAPEGGRSSLSAGRDIIPVTPSVADAGPLKGSLDVLLWASNDDARRQGISLRDPEALPLKAGDRIRIMAALSRAACAYLFWIDGRGEVSPVYPWQAGKWSSTHESRPVVQISLPEDRSLGWPIEASDGMETVLLLARDGPLPDGIDLRQLLAGLPAQPAQDRRSLVWFSNGEVVLESRDQLRGPRWFDPQRVADPVYQTQRRVYERLKQHFPLIVANSFAVAGR